jgi:uncharacterized delta-60 repeat protein
MSVVVALAAIALSAFTAGCGGSGGGGNSGGNTAPAANAGPDRNISTGSLVTLNGSGSTDADGNTLTYIWSFTSVPTDSAAALSSATVSTPTFTADKDGSYVLSLIVNDGTADSAADTVTITAATVSATGVLDTAFNGMGYVVHSNAAGGIFNDFGKGVAVDASGRVVVAGYSTAPGGDYDMAIWRYNADGTMDTTFNDTGYVVHNNAAGGDGGDFGNAMTLDSSGRIVVAGYSDRGTSNYDMVLWRYNTDGTLDDTFNGTGYVAHNNAAGGNNNDMGNAVATDSSGKIVVAGQSYSGTGGWDMTLWRYNTDGTLDDTFNGTGYASHHNAAGGNSADYGNAVAIDSSGKIVVAGYSLNAAGNFDMVVWRYNTNGTLDTSFNGTGYAVHDGAAGGTDSDIGYSVTLDSSGRILVAGYSMNAAFDTDMVVWRYNTDGTLDTSFGGTGYVVHAGAAGGTNGSDEGYSITTDSLGKILVAGQSENAAGNNDLAIWRYNTDGTLDTTFNGTGYAVHDGAAGGGNDEGYAIKIDSSGRIVVAGGSENGEVDPYYDMVVWRYQ